MGNDVKFKWSSPKMVSSCPNLSIFQLYNKLRAEDFVNKPRVLNLYKTKEWIHENIYIIDL